MAKAGKIYYTDKDFTDAEVSANFGFPCILILTDNAGKILKQTAYDLNGVKSVTDFSSQNSKLLTIGNIWANENKVRMELHSSGKNSVLIDNVIYEKTEYSEFFFTPVDEFPKSLIIYALPDADVFHLAEGISDQTYIEPELPTGALVVRKLVADTLGITTVVWDDISGKPQTYPPSAHDHDDRYYTENEVDQKFGNKLDKGGYTGTAQDLYNRFEGKISASQNNIPKVGNSASGKSMVDSGIYEVNGKIGIGTTGEPTEKLEVGGKVKADDFVFADGYKVADNVHQIIINTSASITTDTVGSITGKGQHGRNVRINNGVNAINISCETTSNADFIASYVKLGSGAITFVAGAGATLVQVDGTAILNGAIGSTACLTRNGNTFYLQISNR